MTESKSGKWALAIGGLTMILFSTQAFILDLIEPAKSLGQQVGENGS